MPLRHCVFISAAIVSDLVRIFNIEDCSRTDFPLFQLSSNFALARVYCITVHFDLSHCAAMTASAAGSSSSAGLQDNEQYEESDSSDSDGQSAQPPVIFP